MSPLDCAVWAATWAGSLFISIDMGLLIGIGLALLKLFYETAFPAVVLLALPATAAASNGLPQVREPPPSHCSRAVESSTPAGLLRAVANQNVLCSGVNRCDARCAFAVL